ncbi:MAG: CDP-diacylglycerol O-phosphatidyltransferase [Bacteroidetes bacterium]|nr:MAG: CDP-diacylglycerol O-phosphatidyltransferase [Bacteroidota bacterium]REK06628.1 MAG: CDP-diacylglycerol O-phosphatidyltransferase [Bacteroidota bacterium]REK33394.1 MAG: CDP-diacylglycerol O-phosphatidyltransferase [Bacteroidota bacterium]REK49793.1 MAG: CDP-diacylglycerol O-phosphatidyltransferase [Bacteroidota bacterium]
MKRHIPNIMTCINLLLGCIAAVMVFRNNLESAAYLILLAAFFDFLDGTMARIFNAYTSFGKELDSLADIVSFGFVPGAILFKMLQNTEPETWPLSGTAAQLVQFIPFTVTVFSALRLAKFNTDTRQTSSFIGLPTPANSILICSLPIVAIQQAGEIGELISSFWFIMTIAIILSLLLVSGLKLMSLKLKSATFSENKYRYMLLIFTLILVPILQWSSVPVIFVLYIFFSLLSEKATT